MKTLLLAVAALAFGPWLSGCGKQAPAGPSAEVAATPGKEPAVNATTGTVYGLVMEPVDAAAEPGLGPPPHPIPKPLPLPLSHPKPLGHKPKGYFPPHPGHPYSGGLHGPWAKAWLGHVHLGKHYLYGVYNGTWLGYTFRTWNGRWLYWSPQDYCWYRYDVVLGVFIPLNPDGTDAIDLVAPVPPPPPVPPMPPPPPPPATPSEPAPEDGR